MENDGSLLCGQGPAPDDVFAQAAQFHGLQLKGDLSLLQFGGEEEVLNKLA